MEIEVGNFVRDRAGNRCEYCRLHQDNEPFLRFHIEHIIATQHGGSEELWNLALACGQCNFHKGPNLSGVDPETQQIVTLFHPRQQQWNAHFEIRGIRVTGLTATGRTTIRVLNMNSTARLDLRAELFARGQLL